MKCRNCKDFCPDNEVEECPRCGTMFAAKKVIRLRELKIGQTFVYNSHISDGEYVVTSERFTSSDSPLALQFYIEVCSLLYGDFYTVYGSELVRHTMMENDDGTLYHKP